VVGEFTKECLTIEVERSLTADDVVSTLEYLFEVRGEPEFLRSDNGPEFVAEAVRLCMSRRGAKTLYIAPGSPRENAYSETFNSRLRDELLDRETFETLMETRVIVEDHRPNYNHLRRHSSLGYSTPAKFAVAQPLPDVAPRPPADALPPPIPHSHKAWTKLRGKVELPLRRLGHAPPGFQGFRAKTATPRPFITPVAMFERDLRQARGLARRLAPRRRDDAGALETDRGAVRRGDSERSRRAFGLAPVEVTRRRRTCSSFATKGSRS
jgi:transposase InsO family protein